MHSHPTTPTSSRLQQSLVLVQFIYVLAFPHLAANMSQAENHTDYFCNPNCTFFPDDHNYDHDHDQYLLDFDLSDYLVFMNHESEEDPLWKTSFPPSNLHYCPDPISKEMAGYFERSSLNSISGEELKRSEMNIGQSRVALRMKTHLEVVDDGYMWRKYGKKIVKSNPNPRKKTLRRYIASERLRHMNPRNYYKCSSAGCSVKKRVERDRQDSSYVITTFDGVHNHA